MRQRPNRSIPALALALTLALPAAPALFAQDEQPGVFGEVIDVRVVNIEVVVTDKGTRVTGLGPDDFTLTVDGREVPIEYFTEVRHGAAVSAADEPGLRAVPSLEPGVAVTTNYLVFMTNTSPSPATETWRLS